ncbi:MAG TPA: 16S rRNA (cytosine(967)-C(5))-methyltransferase RsmB [Terracidiphilus sp.]|nr:16S rRNA (cytosine(967)-C(5))-methyltransferase RsmB [Terracidiphilus sp.]
MPPPKRRKSGAISPARRAAFDVLLAVERGPGHSDELLRGSAMDALAQADRNLATALVLGVLRWQISLDERIRPLLKRPGARLDAEVLIALRMGAFQLLYLDRIPAHAAIDESVELAKRAGHRFAAGMVNAVLRSLARGVAARDGEDLRVLEEDFAAAHPAWMVQRWERSFGAEAACAICRHGQQAPRIAVRLKDAQTEEELAAAGVRLEPGALLLSARIVTAGDVTATAAFREGRVRIQDEGSQLIGEIAACAGGASGRRAEQILDLCAAPGGKTLVLAERNPEARIVACEASPARLAALRERLATLESRVEYRLADAASFDESGKFDLALADVPCSGTGTLGRNPEIRHRLREQDFSRQAERQRSILRAALRAVREGGRVVYSTCSLEPEENEQVVHAGLAENAARIIPVHECIEMLERTGVLLASAAERLRSCITPQGALRLMPGTFGTDGFYVGIIERTA